VRGRRGRGRGRPAAQTDDRARLDAEACAKAPLEVTAELRTLFCGALTGPMEPSLRLARIDAALPEFEGRSLANLMLHGGRAQALLGLGRRAEA
jgi:hypothetical protein